MAEPCDGWRERGGGQGCAAQDTPLGARASWEPSAESDETRSRSSRSRTGPASRSSSRSATAAWPPRLSPSIAARRGSWPRTSAPRRDTDLDVQLCGDAHLSNFGVFAAPDRRLIFDINDFDETHPGPFEWDVKRLAASFAIGGRDLGFKERDRRAAVAAAAREYRRGDAGGSPPMRTIDVWYERLGVEALEQYRSQVSKKPRQEFDKARRESREQEQPAGVREAHAFGRRRAAHHQRPAADHARRGVLRGATASEGDLEALDGAPGGSTGGRLTATSATSWRATGTCTLARKVVGVGSVGTRAWIVLLLGRDAGDPLFLQVKEAEASVLEGFAGKSRFRQQGRRVVEGQRLMQAASDIFLGWLTAEGSRRR